MVRDKLNTKEKCTVLVNSCDEYYDLWEPFFTLFKKFWGDCPYQIVLNTEHKMYTAENLNIKCINLSSKRKVAYGERFIRCLRQIETEYIVLLMDDFFLRDKVEQVYIDQLVNVLDNNADIACLSFDFFEDQYNIDDHRIPNFVKRSRYGRYRYNLQAAIWRKCELEKSWKKRETPWQWEVYGNMRSWSMKMQIYAVSNSEMSPIKYGKTTALDWGVIRGRWVEHDVVPLFDRHNISVDYSKRGFLNPSVDLNPSNKMNFSILQKMYSMGYYWFFKYLLWRIKYGIYIRIHKLGAVELDYSKMLNERG